MQDEQKHKVHRGPHAGPKAEKKKLVDKKKRGLSTEKKDPRAFAPRSGRNAIRGQQKSSERDQKKSHVPLIDRTPDVPSPYIIAVVGPPQVGKSTLIRSLIKNYTRQNIGEVKGPITIVSGKKRRITIIECPNDLNSMIDVAKVADLVLLLIDASYGFEMETFEFLNLLQVHGFPRVMGVLTHLDKFKDNKKLKNTKKKLKHRFWTEIYQGAKLFYLSGLSNGRYSKYETHNLARFISVTKFRPLVWRNTHPYILVDRYEDVTDPELVRTQPKADRTILLYGYSRGTFLRQNMKVHLAGVGDFYMKDVRVLPDPCPLPSSESKAKRRTLNEKEKLLYAPMSDLGDIIYDKDAMYVNIPDNAVHFSRPLEGDEGGGVPAGEGVQMVRNLQGTQLTIDDKMKGSALEIFKGGQKVFSSEWEDEPHDFGASRHSSAENGKRVRRPALPSNQDASGEDDEDEGEADESAPEGADDDADAGFGQPMGHSDDEGEVVFDDDEEDGDWKIEGKGLDEGTPEASDVQEGSDEQDEDGEEDGEDVVMLDDGKDGQRGSSHRGEVQKMQLLGSEGGTNQKPGSKQKLGQVGNGSGREKTSVKVSSKVPVGAQVTQEQKKKQSENGSGSDTGLVGGGRHVSRKDKWENGGHTLEELQQKQKKKILDAGGQFKAASAGSADGRSQKKGLLDDSEEEEVEEQLEEGDEEEEEDDVEGEDEEDEEQELVRRAVEKEQDLLGQDSVGAGVSADVRWKDNLLLRASETFNRRVNLAELVYGAPSGISRQQPDETATQRQSAEDSDDEELFKPVGARKVGQRKAEVEEEELDAVESSKDFVDLDTLQDWNDDNVLQSIRNRFVTGDWSAPVVPKEGGEEHDQDNKDKDEEVYGDFEDLETGKQFGPEDGGGASNSEEEADSEEERGKKKADTKAQFDAEYDNKGEMEPSADADVDTDVRAKGPAPTDPQKLLNKSEFANDDPHMRALYEGIRPGSYVRMELSAIPAEFCVHFDPTQPLVVGGLLANEENLGFVMVRIKKHRWHRKILKNNDPLVFSLGWRRFQSLPVYAIQDPNGRYRMLKYTPEHMHCLACFYGPITPPNTGFVAFQNLTDAQSSFRVSATGTVLQLDHSVHIVKKLKLTGVPIKIFKNTAFVKDMFTSSLEVSKFEGASIRTVSGIRGQIKKPLKTPPGAFRATFEDKILASDIVFCRTWYPVKPAAYYNPVTSRLVSAQTELPLMRTVAQLRREKSLPIPLKSDSIYKPVERLPRKFNRLKIPKSLQESLPFSARPQNQAPKAQPRKDTPLAKLAESLGCGRNAVIQEPGEKKVTALMNAIHTIKKQKIMKRKDQQTARKAKKQKELAKVEEKQRKSRQLKLKRKYVAEAIKQSKSESSGHRTKRSKAGRDDLS